MGQALDGHQISFPVNHVHLLDSHANISHLYFNFWTTQKEHGVVSWSFWEASLYSEDFLRLVPGVHSDFLTVKSGLLSDTALKDCLAYLLGTFSWTRTGGKAIWKKSCSSWGWQFIPVVYRVSYMSGGCLEFLPPTVWMWTVLRTSTVTRTIMSRVRVASCSILIKKPTIYYGLKGRSYKTPWDYETVQTPHGSGNASYPFLAQCF